MNDEAWLRDLAQAAQDEEEAERAELDERWIRLSAGELSEHEEAELRALAETSPEARAAYEAFRPLGPDFKARTMKEIRKRIVPEPPSWLALWAAVLQTLTLLWNTPRFAGRLAAAAAMVAAVPVWLALRTPGVASWAVTAAVSLGDVPERSTPQVPSTSPALYHSGSRFFAVLAPESPAKRCESDLVAECYLAGKSELRPWHGCAESAKFDRCGRKGRIDGTVGDSLPLEPGDWRLWTVVGRKGKLPGAEELREDLLGDPASPCPLGKRVGGRNWSAVCVQSLKMESSP